MAEVNVKNQQNSKSQEQGLERRQREGGTTRWRGFDPFSSSLLPFDMFGTDPFSMMRRFQENMERSFSGGREGAVSHSRWNPAIEVSHEEGQLKISAELPGIKPEDVKVEIGDDSITIQGERRYEHEDQRGAYHHTERQYGQFYREILLPEGTKAEDARARFSDGILEVTLPVPERKQQRRSIPIEGSGHSEGEARKQMEPKQSYQSR